MIDNYQIYETRQEAESFLRKNEIGLTHSNYLELKKISQPTPALLGIMTKLVYGKSVPVNQIKEVLSRMELFKNDLKRDKISPQMMLITSFKQDNPIEYIYDILDAVELKKQTLSFINDLQHAKVRNELKTDKFYPKIESGIISLRSTKNWEKQLKFISEKSARFKTAREIISVFETMIRNALGGFSPEGIVTKIESTPGAVVVYNKGGFVVAQVFTKPASCTLGSSSWCISGSHGGYFMSYANPREGKQQYFVWDTSKTPSDLYSLMGITLYNTGGHHTSHIKNDRSFNSNQYFNGLVKNGLASPDLHELLTTSRDTKKKLDNSVIQLNYAIYGGKTITVAQFKTLFKKEWNDSKREIVQDFKNLFNLYYIVTNVNKINYSQIEKERKYITYKRIHNDLKKLATELDIEEILLYLMESKGTVNQKSITDDIIIYIMNSEKFNDIDQLIKTEAYIMCNELKGKILNYPEKIPLELPTNSIGFEEGLSQHSSFDEFFTKYDKHLDNIDFDLTIKDHYSVFNICAKNTIKSGKYVPSKIINFFFKNITNLNCDTLFIFGYSSKVITIEHFNKISISSKLVFSNTTDSYNIDNILRKTRVSKLMFLNSDLINFRVTSNVPLLDEITLIRTNLNVTGNMFLPTKKLNLEYAGILSEDIPKFDLVFMEELRATTDVLYNLTDEIKKELKDENVKIVSIGGLRLPMLESMKSNLLSALYSQFDDKTKLKSFIKLLNHNKIDVHNISDDQIEYTSSVNLKRVVEKNTTNSRSVAFIIICIKANEGIKYIINYQKSTPQNNSYRSRSSTPTWTVKFLNDELKPITTRAKKNIEISKDIFKDQTALPTIKKVIDETDYIFILNKKDIKSFMTTKKLDKRKEDKKGSDIYKKDIDYKNDLIKRLDSFIKTKYVFKSGDDQYDINYINKVSSRLSSLYNIIYHKEQIDIMFGSVSTFVSDKKTSAMEITESDFHLPPVFFGSPDYRKRNSITNLPTKKTHTVRGKPVTKSDALMNEIQTKINNLIPYSKSSNITFNMNNYKISIVELDKNIYPNVKHLTTLKTNLEKIENTIKKHFIDNPVSIEFISDLDLFVEKYTYISTYIQKLFLTETSLPIIIHNLGEKNNLNHEMNIFKGKVINAVYPFGLTSPLNFYLQKIGINSKKIQNLYQNFSGLRAEILKTRPNQRILKLKLNSLIEQHIDESEMVLKKLNLFFKL